MAKSGVEVTPAATPERPGGATTPKRPFGATTPKRPFGATTLKRPFGTTTLKRPFGTTNHHSQSDLTRLSAAELAALLNNGEVSSVAVTQAHLDRIAEVDGEVKAFLVVNAEDALATAAEVDKARAKGAQLHPLAGVPIAVKDNVVTSGLPTTAGSKILAGWVPPYNATIVDRIKAAGLPILGKTNLDEFAMGSSTEYSAFGPSHNPWDLSRVPGGSGGGSAASLVAYEAPLAIGSDTGGSIRAPGSYTGTVGAKPTYGSVSRYGLIALASSLDQLGPATRNVLDAAMLHELIGGYDPHDSTSINEPLPALVDAAIAGRTGDLAGVRVGVITELHGKGYQKGVEQRFDESLAALEQAGAEILAVSCPHFAYALDAYYLILPAEASSNLARYDGVRYGNRVEPNSGPVTAETMMAATREAGFGPEVKRRIILGTYALSAGYYDAYYGSAQQVRTLIQRDFADAFAKVDVLVSPTTPTTAFQFGAKTTDPMAMYLTDITTIPANLAGVPSISVPNGLAEDGMPTGFQIMAPAKADDRMYRVGAALETLLEAKWGGPLLAQAPELSLSKASNEAGWSVYPATGKMQIQVNT